MDQDPTTAGGTGTDNMVTSEPGQDTQTYTNEPTMTNAEMTPEPMAASTPDTQPVNAQPAMSADVGVAAAPAPETTTQPQVFRPVDSHHIERDLRLPGDKAKRRTQIIIGAIVGALILILGGLAIWFFAFYNNPEKAMLDGVNNLFRASNISLDGGITLMSREDDEDSSIQMVILNLNSSSSKLPNSTDVSLLITFAEEKSVNLQLGTVQMTDGVIYLKVSGIMDSLRSMGIEAEVENEMEELFSALETIDGEWWRISVRDVLKDLTSDTKIADLYGSLYDCALDASTRDNSRTLVDLYKQNRFIKVKPVKEVDSGDGFLSYQAEAWHNLYEISFDTQALADFINALPETDMAQEMYACYNRALVEYDPYSSQLSAEDFSEISASDIDIPKDLHLYAEVSQFGHKIRSLWAYTEDNEWQNSFAVLLGYNDAVVSAPSEYRDITELFKELPIEDMWSSVTLPSSDPYDDDYDYGYDYDWGDDSCYCPDSIDVECDCFLDEDDDTDGYFNEDETFYHI